MKRVVLLLALAGLVFVSCEKDPKSKLLDPNAKISIRPSNATLSSSQTKAEHLSALEIVKQTTDVAFHSPEYPEEAYVTRMFSEEQRDIVNLRLMMWGDDIIQNGKLVTVFIGGSDVLFITREEKWLPIKDTVGYIPNSTLRTVEVVIKAAYAAQDYEQVYKLFDEAYRFIPITGKEWRALKAQGKQ